MMRLFRRLSYKLYQYWFCKQFINRSKSLDGYEHYLKHLSKKDSMRCDFIQVALYDVLDNDGMNKLVKKLYKLKNNENYNVDPYYVQNKFIKKNYINSNLTGNATGVIGIVTFTNDKWLKKIRITYTYLNTSEAVIEYCFTFKRIMCSYSQIHNFIIDNMQKSIIKPPYFHTYADKKIIKKANCNELLRLDAILFDDVLQEFVCTMFYTRLGREYKLPSEYSVKLYHKNKRKVAKLRKTLLQECYEKKDKSILINELNYHRFEVSCYYSGKNLSSPFLLSYFTNFSLEMYYKAFGKIEIAELENRMRKYLNSRRSFVSSKDIKWLINKVRYIREQEEKIAFLLEAENGIYAQHMLGWTHYYRGQKKEGDFIDYPKQTKYYKRLFEQSLEYLNSIASVQNDKTVIVITISTLLATIIGVVIALF